MEQPPYLGCKPVHHPPTLHSLDTQVFAEFTKNFPKKFKNQRECVCHLRRLRQSQLGRFQQHIPLIHPWYMQVGHRILYNVVSYPSHL